MLHSVGRDSQFERLHSGSICKPTPINTNERKTSGVIYKWHTNCSSQTVNHTQSPETERPFRTDKADTEFRIIFYSKKLNILNWMVRSFFFTSLFRWLGRSKRASRELELTGNFQNSNFASTRSRTSSVEVISYRRSKLWLAHKPKPCSPQDSSDKTLLI